MRIFILLQLGLILLSCGRDAQLESERKGLVAALEAKKLELEAEQKEKERAYQERLAKIPPFIGLGDTLNYTDENGWKQGIWEFRVEGLDQFNITPAGKTEALQLDGNVQEIRQYFNDTLRHLQMVRHFQWFSVMYQRNIRSREEGWTVGTSMQWKGQYFRFCI